jgi:SAM-dependent methyltransferase
MELTRHYAKACDLPDFSDPELAALIEEIDPSQSAERPHRKGWEFAMTATFLRDAGVLRDDAEVLDVGAGSEPILFWLASRVRRVVAIDIYGRGGFGEREATRGFLDDPAQFAPYDYPRERLEVRDMDARELDFPDASFDAVVSLSSIEHFGGPDGIRRSAAEIGRVLKPGGVAFIVTEVFLRLSPVHRAAVGAAVRLLSRGRRAPGATLERRPIDGFLGPEIRSQLIEPAGLRLMQPLDLRVGQAARANAQMMQPDGTARSESGAPYPHIVVGVLGSRWTSVGLPLVKPG